MLFVGFLIEASEKIDGFEILASAELVGDPLALFAGVVEIEHRRNGVDPQTVDVILVVPEHRARHQKAAYFGAAVIEDVRFPIGMEPLAGISMFVQMRTVEISESVAVRRE